MPIPEQAVKSYTDLGVVGAALLILLIFVILMFTLFKFYSNQTTKMITRFSSVETVNQTASIEKLVTKIDQLITSNAEHTGKLNEVLLANDKDQKVLIRTLDKMQTSLEDILKKVVRIDDRTYSCLGNSKPDRKGVV